jgi:hypothetical protein
MAIIKEQTDREGNPSWWVMWRDESGAKVVSFGSKGDAEARKKELDAAHTNKASEGEQ